MSVGEQFQVISFMRRSQMGCDNNDQGKTVRERMAEEEQIKEKMDSEGNRWRKAYFGGGEHFQNWLAQCRELGEVMVEEVDSSGYTCFEEGGEKLYRIWVKLERSGDDDGLF
jgi:hypothetical protein